MLLFLLFGPEMSQEERQEEAEAAMNLERLRLEGVSPALVGERRATGTIEQHECCKDEEAMAEHVE